MGLVSICLLPVKPILPINPEVIMKKIAVILSGCGNRDGSELQESLGLLLAIDRQGWQYQCFAPEGFFEVVPHIDVEDTEEEGTVLDMEQRDIFVESARIARGNLLPIEEYKPADYDALALPGGMGAARNLSTFAFDGPRMEVVDSVADAILETYRIGKPVVAMCIARCWDAMRWNSPLAPAMARHPTPLLAWPKASAARWRSAAPLTSVSIPSTRCSPPPPTWPPLISVRYSTAPPTSLPNWPR